MKEKAEAENLTVESLLNKEIQWKVLTKSLVFKCFRQTVVELPKEAILVMVDTYGQSKYLEVLCLSMKKSKLNEVPN